MIRALRLALAAIGIVAVAWYAIGARQAHDVDAVTALLDHQAVNSAAASHRAGSLLNSADFLYPGVGVTLLRARLDMARRDFARAKLLVDQALAAEPDNLNAWISALDLAIDHPGTENTRKIFAHVRALDPVDARSFTR